MNAPDPAAFAAARGLKRADVLYAPALNLNLVHAEGGLSLFLSGQAGYDIHQRNSILDRERLNLQAGADAFLVKPFSASLLREKIVAACGGCAAKGAA